MKILIVEDEWISANFLRDIIENLGHEVVGICANAHDTIENVRTKEVDFIFMDINIEGPEDGITLARMLNQERDIPILYLTAYGDSDTIDDASSTNIYGFLIKPYTKNDIEAALHVALSRRKKESYFMENRIKKDDSKIYLGHSYVYDIKQNTLRQNSELVILSRNELKLLEVFCKHHDQIVGVDTLKNEVWPQKEIGESTIRDTILRLRKKIAPLVIENITGIGYMLKRD